MGERLSALDTMFLDLEEVDDGATMHFGGLLLFDALPEGGAPDIARVREHVQRRLSLVPSYRMRLSRPRTSRTSWTAWEPAPSFDLAAHIRHATLPGLGGDAELHEFFADFLSHRLDRRRPLWETVLVDGLAGGRWALATKTHHCLVDGVGSVDIGQILLDTEPSPPQWGTSDRQREVEPQDTHAGLAREYPELLVRGAKAGAGALRHPRATLARAAAVADLVVHEELIAAPDCSLNGPLSASRDYRAVRFELDDIKAIERALGGTVNDVVLAISTGGLRRLLLARGEAPPAGGLRAQIPVNIRPPGREHATGNVLTSLFVELPVDEPDPLVRYQTVAGRAEALKTSSQPHGGKALIDIAGLAPPLVGELLGRAMFGGRRVFNLTITNVRASATPLYAFGAPLRDVLPYVPLFASHSVGIAVVSYAGGLVFGLGADRTRTPDLATLAEGIEASFAELQRATRPRRRPRARRPAAVSD